MSQEAVDVSAILSDGLKPLPPRFEARGQVVKPDFSGFALHATEDPALVRVIPNNLFDNTVCYTPPASEVRIRSGVTGGLLEIHISNPASDLPEDLDPILFEPLLRR